MSADRAGLGGKSREAEVMARAQERLDILLAGKVVRSYDFISAAGRTAMSVEQYLPRMNTGHWRKAVAKSAECVEQVCEVTVSLDYVLESIPLNREIKEKWILDGSTWWYVYPG